MHPGQRLNIIGHVAHFESRICNVTSAEPYFDELHDFYEVQIDGFTDISAGYIESLERAEAVQRLSQTLIRAKYRPADA